MIMEAEGPTAWVAAPATGPRILLWHKRIA